MLLCVLIPDYALAVARRDRPDLGDVPALLADKPDRGRVLAVDASAHAAGARVGQTVLQARAAANDAHVLVHDPVRSRAVWSDMLDALDAVSPLVDDTAEGLVYLDMRGIDGDPDRWISRAHAALDGFDLPVRAAVGSNKFVARAAAYVTDGRVCNEKEARTLVSPLPVELLDLDPRTAERLHLLGVRTLGELAQLPHGPLVRRFGKTAATWHARANAEDPTPFLPRAHEMQIDASLYGQGAADREEQLYFALRMLADRVCSDLTRVGKGAAMLHVTFECESGELHSMDVGLAQATADPRAMLDVVRAKLEGQTFDSPVTGLRLQAARLEELGTPATLFASREPDPQAIALALARLESALGTSGTRVRTQPAHRFEQRFAYETFAVPPSGFGQNVAVVAHPVPQLRLLAVREIPVVVRGHAPSYVGSPPRAVMDCAGPWRIEEGWFDGPVTRDEYDVLLEDGELYRIYRQGECWYVRGAYD
ncbi:MAG: DNA polymerase Y family protein [Vulcanimicrobiaceae bacterium]